MLSLLPLLLLLLPQTSALFASQAGEFDFAQSLLPSTATACTPTGVLLLSDTTLTAIDTPTHGATDDNYTPAWTFPLPAYLLPVKALTITSDTTTITGPSYSLTLSSTGLPIGPRTPSSNPPKTIHTTHAYTPLPATLATQLAALPLPPHLAPQLAAPTVTFSVTECPTVTHVATNHGTTLTFSQTNPTATIYTETALSKVDHVEFTTLKASTPLESTMTVAARLSEQVEILLGKSDKASSDFGFDQVGVGVANVNNHVVVTRIDLEVGGGGFLGTTQAFECDECVAKLVKEGEGYIVLGYGGKEEVVKWASVQMRPFSVGVANTVKVEGGVESAFLDQAGRVKVLSGAGKVVSLDDSGDSGMAGSYVHSVANESVNSYLIGSGDAAMLVARYVIPSTESLVSVTYPSFGGVVQHPAKAMGDDGLLLKYLNRNLAVVATLVVGDDSKLGREWVGSEPGSSKKPRGVDGQDQGAEEASMPSVYVTFVDTVSGRVLYRVGHSDASIIGSELGCVIVENAVYYTTFNTRTKRSEISSVTLWDGIVTPDQITMFKSFETEKTFSSVGSQGPIPLARTFVYPKTLTSLAVSVTRSGVSSKALLGTLVGGQVVSIDVRMLDPRRPSSEPTKFEKMEGLMKYEPMVPFIPSMVASYSQVVGGVDRVFVNPTRLESQCLMLAIGSEGLFVTRLSPSRSFDILPSSFSRVGLVVAMVGLIGLYLAVKRYGEGKATKMAWA